MRTRARMAILTLGLAMLAVGIARPDAPKVPTSTAPVTVPTGVAAFASVHVAAAWDHEAFGPIREARGSIGVAWATQSFVGLIPADIDRLTIIWPKSAADTPFLIVVGRKAVDPAVVVKALTRAGAPSPKPLPGGKVLVAPGAEFPFVRPVDARTLVLAPASADSAGIEAVVGLIPALTSTSQGHTLAVGMDAKALTDLPIPIGGPLVEFTTATLTVDLGKDTAQARLAATYPTAEKARAAAPLLRTKLDELAGWSKEQGKKAASKPSPGNASPVALLEWIGTALKATKVRADENVAVATVEINANEAVYGLIAAVPDAAVVPRGASAAENNLKQIGIAMHAYHDTYGQLPANSYDKDGKPLLSWRVHILPYVEQQALYQQFKLDQPWDSPANLPFSAVAVKVYAVPGRPAGQPNETYFRMFIGPKDVKPDQRPLLIEGDSKGPKIQAIADGTSNTLLVVEAGESVVWSKPDDLVYDGVRPIPKLGGPNGSFSMVFADGSSRTLRRAQLPDATLRGMITMQGGEVFSLPGR